MPQEFLMTQRNYNTAFSPISGLIGEINWVQAERTWSSDGAELLSGCNYCQATI